MPKINSTTLYLLDKSWDRTISFSPNRDMVLDGLIERWCESHRHYHDLEHLLLLLYQLDTELDDTKDVIRCTEALYLAAWYHDAIYDTKAQSGVNELNSAKLAYFQITEYLGFSEGIAQTVSDLIMSTVEHNPSCPEEGILSDADLAVLGSIPTLYNKYIADLRKEYGWVSEHQWVQGRSKFLKSMLSKTQIFYDSSYWYVEEQARQNMQIELSNLSAYVAT